MKSAIASTWQVLQVAPKYEIDPVESIESFGIGFGSAGVAGVILDLVCALAYKQV